MKKWRIEYCDTYQASPMSFWVHRHLDQPVWRDATRFEPPLPRPVAGRGYAILVVSFLQTELKFASVEEAEQFLSVIRQTNLPTSSQLTALRGTERGPNSHWLSRLPAEIKAWRKREKLIPIIQAALQEYKAALNKN